MNQFAIILIVCYIVTTSSIPVHNGMMYYRMPYYNPYQQAMLVHYAQPMGRTSATSVFASGDSIAAGSYLRENRVQNEAAFTSSSPNNYNNDNNNNDNDGTNVEAIAEAYPQNAPGQEAILYDSEQQNDQPNLNEVIPLNAAPVTENDDKSIVIQDETTTFSPPTTTTVAPKKKVHISLDDDDDDNDDIEDEFDPIRPQKPNRNPNRVPASPTYTFFPVTFGRTAGGTVAIANAYSTGKGAVRSHAIAYGTASVPSRQLAAKRHISDKQ